MMTERDSGAPTARPRSFAEQIIDWQRHLGRHDLPWQNTRDAYRIWLSEIMLQQTQVATAIPYYTRFLERFPDVGALAAAPVNTVLEHWAGLGYYARARNLHRCAQTIVYEHGGRFPVDPTRLAALPGIGRSTAAAISAFAYGTRAAILDGNVKRVLARCFGIDGFPGTAKIEKEMWALAESLLPATRIEAYTQGLMDLGASVCSRTKPACTICPLAGGCIACRDGRQQELPTPKPKKLLPERETHVFILSDGQHVLLERRPPLGIWGGLLALPEIGHDRPPESLSAWNEAAAAFAGRHNAQLLRTRELPPLRHTFSHFHLTIRALYCAIERQMPSAAESGREWLPCDAIGTAALPPPLRRLLQAALTPDNSPN
ncbi:A/G-specific adenine glycosylase [Propionivibrio limicola]|uniref:A/G-specific adenine glycosylase n=1 Tax=Propionivibrio limicola TaxID=167645 RepID=UPI001290F099|nr:A/G-specific adenine glycosylase [Propionivibrio limicola]